MTAESISRMPKTDTERCRHRTRKGQPHVNALSLGAGVSSGPPRHARTTPTPRPVVSYRPLEGAARGVTRLFVAVAVGAAALLVGHLSTPAHPATQPVEWVTR
jgi:hypothetical protein